MKGLAGALAIATMLCLVLAARVHVDGPSPGEPEIVVDADSVERARIACEPGVIAADLYIARAAIDEALRQQPATEVEQRVHQRRVGALYSQLADIVQREHTCDERRSAKR